mgnify:CR=1 FL=1
MSKIFESLRMRRPGFSAFDLSHEVKLSCNMGSLIPVLTQEIVPGDVFNCNTEVMVRFSPMIAPVMHRINVYVHYFFVPNRIVWDQWEEFITGGQDGDSTPAMPTITMNNFNNSVGQLGDYMGIGYGVSGTTYQVEVNALPFRAYQEIYNEYYRDETLQDPIDWTVEGSAATLRTRCWEKDYFTSALPWTQRGAEVGVPLTFNPQQNQPDEVYWTTTNPPTLVTTAGDVQNTAAGQITSGATNLPSTIDNSASLDITINDLRQTSRLQEWLEKNARGGYRYIEQLLSHFGVRSSDARLQRPEYLGGSRQPVVISEVLNTSATATQEQGTMAGHGIAVGAANRAKRRFEEHGWLFGIMSILPRTAYQQGVPRHFLRTDKLDYYFPEFAHLGEQEIKQLELYYDKTQDQATNEATFGYQQRYAEYKYGCSRVAGDFRDTLDYWHMGRIFGSAPALNSTFVQSDPTTRIFAVETGDQLWCQVYNDVKARRPMPYFKIGRASCRERV